LVFFGGKVGFDMACPGANWVHRIKTNRRNLMNQNQTIAASQLRAGQRIIDAISHRVIVVKSVFKCTDESLRVVTEAGESRLSACFRVRLAH
jgi:hypothetical protein